MTTATAPTKPELDERLATAKTKVAEAESAVGRAAIDGVDEADARKRWADARAEVDVAEAALAEHDRREAEAHETARLHGESELRQGAYEWTASYLRAGVEVVHLREALSVAEGRVRELGVNRLLWRRRNFPTEQTVEEAGLDVEVANSTPIGPAERRPTELLAVGEYDSAHCEAMIERAGELAAQEAASRG